MDIFKTSLLLHANGANNSTSIFDELGNTCTSNGNVKISTTQSKFGGSSIFFDGSGDYLSIGKSPNFGLGVVDFTLEAFIFLLAGGQNTDRAVIDFREANGSDGGTFFVSNTNKLAFWYGTMLGNNVTTLNVDTWYHVALTRTNGVFKCFLNGVLEWESANYVDLGSSRPVGIGGAVFTGGVGSAAFFGYIDELRVIKGTAKYTANFTPPTVEFSVEQNLVNGFKTEISDHIEYDSWWDASAIKNPSIDRDGVISGTVKIAGVLQTNTKVHLFFRKTGVIIKTAYTDSNGAFLFKCGLNRNVSDYFVIAMTEQPYNAQIFDKVTPA